MNINDAIFPDEMYLHLIKYGIFFYSMNKGAIQTRRNRILCNL